MRGIGHWHRGPEKSYLYGVDHYLGIGTRTMTDVAGELRLI